ncbi:hypothetical protein [Thermococcus stetteri]|uniref:hypothetical protein n=1 Tax=Thermococcus stetteri TaxID=49900 RepID=UPI001AEA4EC8|nr:hypothetical protein [Thermococcus stetteri]MBP1912547.1 hypothetical protein [Thermococcus stetteri]
MHILSELKSHDPETDSPSFGDGNILLNQNRVSIDVERGAILAKKGISDLYNRRNLWEKRNA